MATDDRDHEQPGSRPEPAPAEAPGEVDEPTSPDADGEHRCDLCAAPMQEWHCRIICRFCGYQRDCSDP